MPNTNAQLMQPIIRGVQSVGAVQILYRYNNKVGDNDYRLPLVDAIKIRQNQKHTHYIQCTGEGIPVAGFRLDAEFLRANPQIASSFVIPILGGGGVALTNNNRTGTLNLVCTKVTAPDISQTKAKGGVGKMLTDAAGSNGLGVLSKEAYYDFVTLAQIQQAQEAGDSVGARLKIVFNFCNVRTTLIFDGCTIATVDPIGLAGNDAVNYAIAVNYLNWSIDYTEKA